MTIVFLNGAYSHDTKPLISHQDSGFTTGIGIFDSMLAVDGALIHEHEHFARIIHDSEQVIGITPPMNFSDFQTICLNLLKRNNLMTGHARIRTTVTGGVVTRPLDKAVTPTILIQAAECLPANHDTPLTCLIIDDFPRIAGCTLENCKRLDYSRSYAARLKAQSLGADDAILTNTSGNIACGTTSNIFIEENGTLITPPLSEGVLAGITRHILIQEKGAKEEIIDTDRLKKADQIFLTNSFIGLKKVILK